MYILIQSKYNTCFTLKQEISLVKFNGLQSPSKFISTLAFARWHRPRRCNEKLLSIHNPLYSVLC